MFSLLIAVSALIIGYIVCGKITGKNFAPDDRPAPAVRISDGVDYTAVWRYFSRSNQTIAMIALWTVSACLRKNGRKYMITALPAAFMSAVTITYFVAAPECPGLLWSRISLADTVYYPIAVGAGIAGAILFSLIFMEGKTRENGEYGKNKSNRLKVI